MPKMTTDDGIELHYHVDDFRDPWITDPGDPVVFTHGFSRSMKWWVQWVPALSRKFRVVRYDMRGCGQSSVPPEGPSWSADRLARDVLNLIDHLGAQRIHWIGFESGGMWGKMFAVNHPDRLKSLTLCNTPATNESTTRPMDSLASGGGQASTPLPSEEIKRVGLRQFLINTNSTRWDMSVADPRLPDWHLAEHSKTPTHVAASIMQIVETLDLPALHPRIQAPTLIMASDRSPAASAGEHAVERTQIPNARLVVFPNTVSGIHLTMPDRCTAEVLRFLADVEGATG